MVQPNSPLVATPEVRSAKCFELKTNPTLRKGLCTTCDHSDDCHLSKATYQATWSCNEFQDIDDNHQATPQSYYDAKLEEVPKGSPTKMGLCAYCNQADNCSLHKCIGGIWHCEEYE